MPLSVTLKVGATALQGVSITLSGFTPNSTVLLQLNGATIATFPIDATGSYSGVIAPAVVPAVMRAMLTGNPNSTLLMGTTSSCYIGVDLTQPKADAPDTDAILTVSDSVNAFELMYA